MRYGERYRVSQIQKMSSILSQSVGTQRTARVCNELAADGLLVKEVDQKIIYFSFA